MIFHYKHKEWFEKMEEPRIDKNQRIFLWGAGKIGSIVAYALKQRGFDFIAFVDIAKDKQGKSYCGHKVISPEEFYHEDKQTVVICSCTFPNVMDIVREKGYFNTYAPIFLLQDIDFTDYVGDITPEFAKRNIENALRNYALYYNTGLLLERLVVVITDKCSLKCKNCDGYAAYHDNPQNDSVEDIQNSYNQIMDVCKNINAVDIMGGEPLVHPDIVQIVKKFVDDKRCERVTIISNGTIVPQAELLEILMNSKCVFRISDYGKISSKKGELIKIFETKKIQYEITNYQYWDKVPQVCLTNETEKELDLKFATCTTNACYIKHGKMFCCTFVAGLSSLIPEQIPDFEKNYVELLKDKPENIKKNVAVFIQQLHERKHIDACKYCPGGHCIQFEDKQPVAEQADGVLPLDNLFKDGKRICISQT